MPHNKLINDFLATINKHSTLVLSMDLDNTLVNREKGDNYVFEDTLELIKLIQQEPNFYLVPNTGRDIIGFNSFIKETVSFLDAILGAGSLIKTDNRYIFDSNSEIKWPIIQLLLKGIKSGALPFIDITHKDGRLLIYNNNGLEFKDLFYSQNPRSWFGQELPPAIPLKSLESEIKFVYRIEFPVLPLLKDLYDELIHRRENGIIYLADILGVSIEDIKGYTVKRKAFLNDQYKNKLSFARFEKHTDVSSKGHGIKTWLNEKNLNHPTVIHVGDQDYGVINDTLVKSELLEAKLVMVGNRCQHDNPLVDLYLTGDVDIEVNEFVKSLYLFITSKENV